MGERLRKAGAIYDKADPDFQLNTELVFKRMSNGKLHANCEQLDATTSMPNTWVERFRFVSEDGTIDVVANGYGDVRGATFLLDTLS